MAFTPKTYYPEGHAQQTPINTINLNDLENRIANALKIEDKSSAITIASGFTSDNSRQFLYKQSDMISLDLLITGTSIPATFTTVATLPTECAPTKDIFCSIYCDNGNAQSLYVGACRISTNGNIDVLCKDSEAKRVGISHSWIKK